MLRAFSTHTHTQTNIYTSKQKTHIDILDFINMCVVRTTTFVYLCFVFFVIIIKCIIIIARRHPFVTSILNVSPQTPIAQNTQTAYVFTYLTSPYGYVYNVSFGEFPVGSVVAFTTSD